MIDSTFTGMTDALRFDGSFVGFFMVIQRTTMDGPTVCGASYRALVGWGFVNDSAIDIRDSSLVVAGTGSTGRAFAASVGVLSSVACGTLGVGSRREKPRDFERFP